MKKAHLLILVLFSLLVMPGLADAETDGRNVARVDFAGGYFVAVDGNGWEEHDRRGVKAVLVEQQRTRQFVALANPARKTRINLDVANGVIWYAREGGAWQKLDDITGMSEDDRADNATSGELWKKKRKNGKLTGGPGDFGTVEQKGDAKASLDRSPFPGVSGFNIGRAEFAEGAYVNVDGKDWVKRSRKGTIAVFRETDRTQQHTVLYDATRKVYVSLDTIGGIIWYAEAGENWQKLYVMVDASAMRTNSFNGEDDQFDNDQQANFRNDVNGLNVERVRHERGVFINTTGKEWVEKNRNQITFTFQEYERTKQYAVLYDASRNVYVSIDIVGRTIWYAEGRGDWKKLYDIIRARAVREDQSEAANPVNPQRLTGLTAGRIEHSRGAFIHAGRKDWIEQTRGGRVAFRFREYSRNNQYVTLLDESRNVYVSLDITNQIIWYAEAGKDWQRLYDITHVDG